MYHLFKSIPACLWWILCQRVIRLMFQSCLNFFSSSNRIWVSLILPAPCVTPASEEELKLAGHRAAASRPNIPRAALIHPDREGHTEAERQRQRERQRKGEGVMAALTKAFNRLGGQNMHSLFYLCYCICALRTENVQKCVCGGALRPAFIACWLEIVRGRLGQNHMSFVPSGAVSFFLFSFSLLYCTNTEATQTKET